MPITKKNIFLTVAVVPTALYFLAWLLPDSNVVPPKASLWPDSQLVISQVPVKGLFSERSLEKRLNHMHTQTSNELSSINETLGSGVCAFDYDNDGWIDIFIVGGSGHTRHYGKGSWWHSANGNALFKNIQGDGFTDVTTRAGLAETMWGMGCASADLDNDGDSDLLITSIGRNHLYQNNSDGTYTDVTQSSGLKGENWSTSIAIADYDLDGLLDIYVGNYIHYEKGARTFEFNAGFETTVPVSFNASLYDGVANKLYRNLGGLRFDEMANIANVDDPAGRTLGVSWLDINNDNFPDLLITNDKGSPSQLFINDEKGRFSKAGAAYRVETANGGHSAVSGNINNDHSTDIVVSTPVGQPAIVLINDGASLSDIAWDSGVARSRDQVNSGWGSAIADFNNDGWLDMYFANGMIIPDSNAPAVPQGQQNQLLLSAGNGQFLHVPAKRNSELSSRGIAYADFDNDGDIDLIITNNNNAPTFLVNNSATNNWLGVELVNKHGNQSGLGAKIQIIFGDGDARRKILRENFSRTTFLSHSEHRFHFGIGTNEIVHEINVTWPEGNQSNFGDIAANQYVRIDEKSNTLSLLDIATDIPGKIDKLKPPFDKYRANYLVWEAIGSDFTNGIDELFQLFVKGSETEQLGILTLLELIQRPEILPILNYALSAQNVDIKLNAIRQIEKQEYEPSVYWLLDLFSDDSVEVKCQLAKTFKFFFQEEEAVRQRKYLAVPYLIRMLDDNSDPVKVCALEALAEAERYRGINAIQALLIANNDTVRAKAIEALGKIRDRKYLTGLTQLILADDESPEILAYTLVALKRLDEKNIDDYLHRLISLDLTETGALQLNRAILISSGLLIGNTDNIVISPDTINKLLLHAISDYRQSNSLLNLEQHPLLLEHYFSILSTGKNPDHVKFIEPLTKSKTDSVRISAYETLISVGSIQAIQLSEKGLFDASNEVKNAVYTAFYKHHISVSNETLKNLLSHKEDLGVITRLASPEQRTALSEKINDFLMSQNADEAALTSLLFACYESNLRDTLIPEVFFQHQNKELALSAIACASTQNNAQMNSLNLDEIISDYFVANQPPYTFNTIDALLKSEAAWTNRLLLKLLNHTQVGSGINKYLITAAIETKNPSRQLFVIKALKSKNVMLKTHTISQMLSLTDNKQIQAVLYDLLNDASEDESVRIQIANLMVPIKPEILTHMLE